MRVVDLRRRCRRRAPCGAPRRAWPGGGHRGRGGRAWRPARGDEPARDHAVDRRGAHLRADPRDRPARDTGPPGRRPGHAEILGPARSRATAADIDRTRDHRHLRDERDSVVVSLPAQGRRRAAPRSVTPRPRGRARTRGRARARRRLHDQFGQRHRRARRDPQLPRHQEPLHARRARRHDLAPVADDLAGLRARRHPDPAHRDDPRRHLGQAGAEPQHQPDLRPDRRADRRARPSPGALRAGQGADARGAGRLRRARHPHRPRSRARVWRATELDAQVVDAAGFRARSPARDRRPVDRGAGVRPRRGDRDTASRRDHRAGHREGAADGPLPAGGLVSGIALPR